MDKISILVSACLLGDNVKYNSSNNLVVGLNEKLKDFDVIKVCPEVLAGLGVPRDTIEVYNNKVLSNKGIDVTSKIYKANDKIIKLIKEKNIKYAILKEKSPTCGVHEIYDGTFSHTKIKGSGMLTRTLIENNITVFNELEIGEFLIKFRHL